MGELSKAESLLIELLGCHPHLLRWLQLEEEMEGWENDWDRWESVSFQQLWTVWSWGNQRDIQGPALFPGLFLSCDNWELWISGGHFCCSDSLRIWCFQSKSEFEKLATQVEICLKSDRYCWQMILLDDCWGHYTFGRHDKMDEDSLKEERRIKSANIMWEYQTSYFNK